MSQAINLEKIKGSLEKKDNQYLIDIINYAQDDYHPLVIPIIKELLIDRNFSKLEIGVIDNDYHEIVRRTKPDIKDQKRIPKPNRLLVWLLFIVGLGMLSLLIKLFEGGNVDNIVNIIAKNN